MADEALAPPPSPASPLQVIADNFNKLSQRQKIAGAVALAAAIALVVGVWLWSRQPHYSVLFSNLDGRDGGEVIAALQQANVPYKVEAGGATVLVPADQAAEQRLRLAAQGLPKGGMVGFELLEQQKIGMSQFHEQVNYQRALEGELARTIQSLAAVRGARVHLAIPKQTSFLRDEQKPTASVVLNLQPGRHLEPDQVAGIVHLVASSVPKLGNDAVSILDQNGNLLTQQPSALRKAGLDPTQIKYAQELEDSYIRRIETILTPMVGEGNFRAQVAADVDFDASEQTSETYGPNPPPNTAIRSQQTNESQTNQPPAAGVPGALTNQPPVPATAPLTQPAAPGTPAAPGQPAPLTSNRSATTNYEIDRTIAHVKRSLGQIKRLSVAVVVNNRAVRDPKSGEAKPTPLTQEEIQQITALVREAVGYNEKRGDTLNVSNAPFTAVEREPEPELPLWKDPEIVAIAKEALRWLVVLGVIAFVALGVIRPLLRTVLPPPPKEEEEAPPATGTLETGAEAAEGGEEADKDTGDFRDDRPPEVIAAELAKLSFEKKVARARDIAQRDPKLVAQLIKEWMGGGSGGQGNERR